MGLLPRCSEEWKAEYKKRPIIERYFSSGKHSRLLDNHRHMNIFKVSLHVAMSTLAYLATALAHLKADEPPARIPSPQECRFCDITPTDCPERFDSHSQPDDGATTDF